MAFGSIFKEARERRGVTEHQVAEATKMMVQIVTEFENDDFHRIAAPVYGRGYIKIYANYLDLDPAPLMREFERLYAEQVAVREELQKVADATASTRLRTGVARLARLDPVPPKDPAAKPEVPKTLFDVGDTKTATPSPAPTEEQSHVDLFGEKMPDDEPSKSETRKPHWATAPRKEAPTKSLFEDGVSEEDAPKHYVPPKALFSRTVPGTLNENADGEMPNDIAETRGGIPWVLVGGSVAAAIVILLAVFGVNHVMQKQKESAPQQTVAMGTDSGATPKTMPPQFVLPPSGYAD